MDTLWNFVSVRRQQLLTDSYLHVSAVVQSIIIATIVAILIGVLVYRSPAGSAIATALASTILTVPSFALLGLLIPILGLGVAPTITALVLTRIEMPLAWPSILAGMRVSTQMIFGILAIAAYAKGPGLGNLIFSGLSRVGSPNAVPQALVGTVLIVVLALIVDGILVLVGRLTTSRGLRD
jgi:osmoprotectant transport system permease protein